MMSKPHVTIYTDGCALGNPGISGAGAVMFYGDYLRELKVYLGESTNNRAELEAIICALNALKKPCRVDVYSDSQITVKCANSEFDRNSNLDLWEKYNQAIAGHDVSLHWIRKDTHPMNRKAHKLANEAARSKNNA